jgi:hypothetical protein
LLIVVIFLSQRVMPEARDEVKPPAAPVRDFRTPEALWQHKGADKRGPGRSDLFPCLGIAAAPLTNAPGHA